MIGKVIKYKYFKPAYTNYAPPLFVRGGYCLPVNVAIGGVAATVTTRYEALCTNAIMSLAHYPRTVILQEYDV